MDTTTLDQEKVKQEQERYYEEVRKQSKAYDDKIYNDWSADYQKRTGKTAAFSDHERYLLNDKVNRGMMLGAWDWYPGDQTDAHADWRKFFEARHKQRFDGLDDFQKEVEVSSGGVKTTQSPVFDAYMENALNKFTMGLSQYKATDNIYGTKKLERESAAATAGAFTGEVANFLLLSGIAAGLKVPEAIAGVAEGSSTAAKLLKATGGVSYRLGKVSSVIKPLATYGEAAATQELAAGQGATTALIMGFKNTVQGSMDRFKEQDKMSEKDYIKSIPLGLRDFLVGAAGGYAIHTINAPGAWSLRFMGDALYSTASQGYDILIGKQKEWNNEAFLYNFLMGHVLGEIQGKVLSPYEKVIRANTAMGARKDAVDRAFEPLGVPAEQRTAAAAQLIMMERRNFEETGKMFDDAQVSKAIDVLKMPYQNEAIFKSVIAKDYTDTSDIDVRFAQGAHDKVRDEIYDRLSRSFGWDAKTRALAMAGGVADDPRKIVEFAKKNPTTKKYAAPDYVSREDFMSKVIDATKSVLGHDYTDIVKPRLAGEKARIRDLERAEVDRFDQRIAKKDAADIAYKNVDGSLNAAGAALEKTRNDVAIALQEGYKNAKGRRISYEKALMHKGFTQDEAIDHIGKMIDSVLSKPLSTFAPRQGETAFNVRAYLNAMFNRQKKAGYRQKDVKRKREVSGEENYHTDESGAETTNYDYISKQRWLDEEQGQRELAFVQDKLGGQSLSAAAKAKRQRRAFERIEEILGNHYGQMASLLDRKNHVAAVVIAAMRAEGYKPEEIASIFRQRDIRLGARGGNAFADGDRIQEVLKQFKKRVAFLSSRDRTDTRAVKFDFQKEVESVRSSINARTGLDKRLGSYEQYYIKRNGGYVLNLDANYYVLMKTFGSDVADRFLMKAATIIRNEINEANREVARNGGKIFIRNPDEGNGSRFVLINENIKPDQMKGIVSDIHRVLTDNYDVTEPGKRWGVLVKRVDADGSPRNHLVTGFQDINVSRVTNADQILSSSFDMQAIKQMTNYFGDDSAKAAMSRIIFDSDNVAFVAAVNELRSAFPLAFKPQSEWTTDMSANTAMLPQMRAALDKVAATATMMDTLPSLIKQQAHEVMEKGVSRADVIDNDPVARAEASDALKKNIFDDDYMRDASSRPIDDAPMDADADTAAFAHGHAQAVKEYANQFQGAVGKFIGSARDFIRDKINVYGNLEKTEFGRSLANSIHQWSGQIDKTSGFDVSNFLKQSIEPHVKGLDTRQSLCMNIFGQFLREEEFKTIVKTDANGVAVRENINLRDMEDPIKWRKNIGIPNEMQDALKHPLSITNEMIWKWWSMANDPLFFSKVLVQEVGIAPGRVFGILKDTHNIIYKLSENEYFKYLPGGHAGMDIEREKGFLADSIIKQISSQPDLREFANRLFDLDGMLGVIKEGNPIQMPVREMLDRVIEHMEPRDPNFAQSLKSRVKQYYEIDPAHVTYVSHRVVYDRFNKKKMWSEVHTRQEGGQVTGQRAMSSAMDEFTGRTHISLLNLIESGFDVELKWFESMHSMLTTLKVKNINRYMAENFKNCYAVDFTQALRAFVKAKIGGDPAPQRVLEQFVDEHGGYVYVPTQRDLKEINAVNERAVKDNGESGVDPNIVVKKEGLEYLVNFFKGELPAVLEKKLKIKFTPEEAQALMSDRIAARAIGEDFYLPMNKIEWNRERHGHGRGALVLDMMEKGVAKYRLNAPSLYGWDGLYMSKDVHNVIRQFISRDDYMKTNKYYFLEQLEKGYNKINSTLKVIRLIKPTIMLVNNLFQGMTATPRYLINLPWAYKAYFNRGRASEVGNKEYWLFNSANLFNRASSPGGFLPDATRAVYEIMGRNQTLAKMADDVAGKNFFEKSWITAKYAFKRWQDVSWSIDDMFRLAMCKTFYDKALTQGMDNKKAARVGAAITNMVMVEYSRIPTHTRMALNKIFLYPTYRIGTMRMFKEMAEMTGRGVMGVVNGKIKESPFSIYKDPRRQAFFEMGFALRTIATQAATKTLAAVLLGYGAESLWDTLFDYRMKKKQGDSWYDQDIKFISLSGPLFDLSKYMKRPLEVTLKYNMAAFPGLILSLVTNRNIITQQQIITVDPNREPGKAIGQLSMDLFKTYFVLGGEVQNWLDDDKSIAEKIINFSNLGYFYSQQSPRDMLENFQVAMNGANNMNERQKAYKDFQYKIYKAHMTLFGTEYKDVLSQVQGLTETMKYKEN